MEAAALAIAAGAEQISKVDIAWFPEDILGRQLAPNPSKSTAPYRVFASRHCDIQNLDYERLGELARIVDEAIRQNHVIRISEKRSRCCLPRRLHPANWTDG